MSSILKVDQIQNTDGQSALVIASDGSVNGVKYAEAASPSGRTITSTTMSSFEQGTWVPVPAATNGGFAGTVTINSANYTKIGSTVWVDTYVSIDVTNVGSGHALIRGLPFTVSNDFSPFKAVFGSLVGSNGGRFVKNTKEMAFIRDYATGAEPFAGTGTGKIIISGHYQTNE